MALQQLADWLFTPFLEHAHGTTPRYHRRVLVISGTEPFCDTSCNALIASAPQSITISRFGDSKTRKHVLGTECDIAFFDCQTSFSAGDMMAVAGTIKHGGCLVLICPDLKQWPSKVKTSSLSHGYTLSYSTYVARMVEKLKSNADVAIYSDSQLHLPTLRQPLIPALENCNYDKQVFASDEQARGFNELTTFDQSKPCRAFVTAPRGRGKSSLLGLVASELVRQGKHILLTSSLSDNVAQIFKFATKQLGVAYIGNHHIHYNQGELKWVAPDNEQLTVQLSQHTDFIIVDEAASFPLPLLKTIIGSHQNWILSTTLQGYEGSGNGFVQKLLPTLLSSKAEDSEGKDSEGKGPDTEGNAPLPKHIKLTTPLRWYDEDPIEQFILDTCLFEKTGSNHVQQKYSERISLNISDTTFTLSEVKSLNDDMLCQVMQLLTLAHYQTTPDDLMRLVDSPDIHLATLNHSNNVIAAAIVNVEGGEPLAPLAQHIATGERRPKGHLSAQRLALLAADATLATSNYWRINRIAVLPALQGKGYGSFLLSEIKSRANHHAVDAITTSYGTTTALDSFWTNSGFSIVDKGRKPNKASGETSALAFCAMTEAAKQSLKLLLSLFKWQNDNIDIATVPEEIQAILMKKLQHFIAGSRTLDDVWLILTLLFAALKDNENAFFGHAINQKKKGSLRYLNNNDVLTAISSHEFNIALLKRQLNANGIKDITRILREEIKLLFM
ncbi:MAG: GNAT family N-acetyltransferase [Pseudomonadota bacterium]|nr:GNAT family N-acetyltransferase [Pseudomonadota bacterium]